MANMFTKDIVSAATCVSGGFNFKVRLNGITFGFQSVSGIKVTRNFEFHQEGGVNDHKIMMGMPQDDTFDLTFSRGLILKAPQIVTTAAKAAAALIPNNMARKAAFFALNTLDPQELLESGPSLGDIEVYSTTERGKLIGLYSFLALGIKEWSLADLSAIDVSPLIETFTVAHTGITRMPLSPPMGQYYFNTGSDDYPYQERTEVENNPIDAAKKTAEEMANRKPDKRAPWDKTKQLGAEDIQNLIDDAEEEAEEMAQAKKDNELLRQKVLDSLEKMKQKMKEEYGDDEEESIAEKEWKAIREKGAQKAEELRRIAREKAETYRKEAQKVTELIMKSESKRLENIREHAKELAKVVKKAEQIAQKSSKELAIKLSKFRELKKEKASDLAEETERIEQAKFEALKACELARAMAKSARESAKELQAQNWQKIKEENEKEILKLKEEFTRARKSGEDKTKQSKEEQEKLLEEEKKNTEEIEKKKAEFEQKRQEFMKKIQDMEDEAEETAAEAENAADDAEAMIEAAV